MGAREPDGLTSAPLAMTMGDPAGIGPDITLAAWRERESHALPPFVVFGDPETFAARAAALGVDVAVETVTDLARAAPVFERSLPVWPFACAAPARAGKPDPRNAPAVIGAIEAAVLAIRKGEARAVVTNPVAKSVLMAAGFAHPGHTEFLGTLAETHFGMPDAHPVMLLASDELKVVPLTVHIPLADVPQAITTRSIVRTAGILNRSLIEDFGIARPRIAVTGLNPHAGEDGRLGDEDERIIAPAIAALRDAGLAVTGPYPADTLFHAAARETYDAVLAMYHDQALIPIKTLAFDRGVNVTIGLPFVRTSPDHGTAFPIAGSGTAQARSLIEAIKVADAMSRRRAERV
ncbi:4-hydroxythreonine-4-phosphate dehydrogenase PdxA [Hyphomicrobium sp.]|uniref:4-hydroxythreonine-4-phosphate dehydrogenase PdxA n=1 Tax=Hyphomicrobium sp. TaxID=82 RepID=UPI0025B94CBE|nr:4-hydroxythreonine-4-phosphate dehydrogenase PdxA [Hyphomicrobium sp.]MCC7250747.1 4-hydroxythreonine-4-phosphate dehydrogenase PdxA [Hyphomicrobium sp.]